MLLDMMAMNEAEMSISITLNIFLQSTQSKRNNATTAGTQ